MLMVWSPVGLEMFSRDGEGEQMQQKMSGAAKPSGITSTQSLM